MPEMLGTTSSSSLAIPSDDSTFIPQNQAAPHKTSWAQPDSIWNDDPLGAQQHGYCVHGELVLPSGHSDVILICLVTSCRTVTGTMRSVEPLPRCDRRQAQPCSQDTAWLCWASSWGQHRWAGQGRTASSAAETPPHPLVGTSSTGGSPEPG